MNIVKIVITGGPCAGKTTAFSWIRNYFTKLGWTIIFIPETATELISNGVTPWGLRNNICYQECQMKLQLYKEEVFSKAAKLIDTDKVLIVCDRGTMDNKAYMSEQDFKDLLTSMCLNEVNLLDMYDGVFHLVTAANGAPEFYTLENNSARTETVEQAIEIDNKLISAWTGHSHLRIISNETDFETKMNRLLKEVATLLGEPEPLEIERKYLIKYPDINWLENNKNCNKTEIIQTYLKSNTDEEVRVRQRGIDGNYVYYETKKKGSGIKRVETERRLTQDEYLKLLMNADTSKHQIRKTRYCLTYDNQYFEIDIYPFWKDQAIMEIELSSEDQDIRFPEEITIIKEVTDDSSYKNAALASQF